MIHVQIDRSCIPMKMANVQREKWGLSPSDDKLFSRHEMNQSSDKFCTKSRFTAHLVLVFETTSRSFSRGFHGCSLAMLLFLGLLHFHSGSFHRSNNLFFALFFEPFFFLFIDRIGTVFVLFAIVGQIALLAEKVFVCKFDAVNRVT